MSMMPPQHFIKDIELVLTAFVIIIFIASAYHSGVYAFSHMNEGTSYTFILFSVVSMVVSGLGLIILLLCKLRKIEVSEQENKRIMDLLVPRMAALDASMDGVGLVDAHGNLTYINKALMDLHGLDEQDLPSYIGRSWKTLYSAKGREDIEQKVLPHLDRYGYWKGDAPVLKKNGAIVTAEMSLTLLEDGGLIGTARDISGRLQDQKDREALQNQFFQAQKMEAVGRLAGGIAHDFNNILASMLGYTEFLLEDLPEDSEEHHFATQIMSGGIQAQELVEQILTFSRRDETIKNDIDFTGVVRKTTDMLKATMPTTIMLDVDLPDEDVTISGNGTQIGQVLMNLCVNAIDAMGGERGRLAVRMDLIKQGDAPYRAMEVAQWPDLNSSPPVRILRIDDDNTQLQCGTILKSGSYVRVCVSDTGCGMAADIMEHILEPFYTTKPVDQGTGLGLSSAHGIIAAHHGAMVVNSCRNVGTCFELFFPIAERQAALEEINGEAAAAVQEDTGRILVVEDEARVRQMLKELLVRRGYEVDLCADGDEAIDYLREHPESVDLIISDYTMPHMTGAEMAAEIIDDFPDLPVIILSGYSKDKLDSLEDIHPNIKSVLRKPVRSDILIDQIRTQLSEH
ncbi:MAG: response regulator [Rhodospirillales bacterium]|nr:response regulator [Rhodospirillales bacterium]